MSPVTASHCKPGLFLKRCFPPTVNFMNSKGRMQELDAGVCLLRAPVLLYHWYTHIPNSKRLNPFCEQFPVFLVVFIGQQVFKTKFATDSERTRRTRRDCRWRWSGVSVLMNQLGICSACGSPCQWSEPMWLIQNTLHQRFAGTWKYIWMKQTKNRKS